jgi:hypothetical protein
MSRTACAVPIVVGIAILGGVLASVPPEDRAVQWPILGGLSAAGLTVAALILYHAGVATPPTGTGIRSTGAAIIPFRRAA